MSATTMLAACGPDDGSRNADTSPSSNNASQQAAATPFANPVASAGTSPGTLPTAEGGAAADAGNAVQSAQASLATDSRQVAPVMRYAPGDSGTANGSH